ncbi:triple functional domain protein-like isoform X2 [Pseudophryne corroboree]|uniref:triple functional domain protein-like isoform X2 n=1 Tax=Pseudophryne corroboree TaxID=495146 RepID=UPI003081B4F9
MTSSQWDALDASLTQFLIPELYLAGFFHTFKRKKSSWHTVLRIQKKSENRLKEGKTENTYRKSSEGQVNKVSVRLLNPNYIYDEVHFQL